MTAAKPEPQALEPGCTGAWMEAADGPFLMHWMHRPCPLHNKYEPLSDAELGRVRRLLATIDRERAARVEAEEELRICRTQHANLDCDGVLHEKEALTDAQRKLVSERDAAIARADDLARRIALGEAGHTKSMQARAEAAERKLAEAVEALESIATWEEQYAHREAHDALARLRAK